MPGWYDYFTGMARAASVKSKDATKVGCIIVGEDHEILSTGYNDLPRGVTDKPERRERPAKYLWTSHAEENAVAQAARVGARLKGSTAFVTHAPCCRCARQLIQAGVTTVVFADGQTSMPAEEFEVAVEMLEDAGVKVRAV